MNSLFQNVKSVFQKSELDVTAFHFVMAFVCSLLLTVSYLVLDAFSFIAMGYLISFCYVSMVIKIISVNSNYNQAIDSVPLFLTIYFQEIKNKWAMIMLVALMVFVTGSVLIASLFYLANIAQLSLNTSLSFTVMLLMFAYSYHSLKHYHTLA